MTAALILLLLVAPAASLLKVKDPCSCIPWNSAYKDHGARCGQGFEYAPLKKYPMPLFGGIAMSTIMMPADLMSPDGQTSMGTLFEGLPSTDPLSIGLTNLCTEMFIKFNFSGCVNKGMGWTDQWCYVSRHCNKDIIGYKGHAVPGTDLKIKECSASDTLMADAEPEELNKIAVRDHVDIGVLAHLFYPIKKQPWSAVEGASGLSHIALNGTHTFDTIFGAPWGFQNLTGAKLLEAQRGIEAARAYGSPVVFQVNSAQGGGVVVHGEKIYASTFTGDETYPVGYIRVDNITDDTPL